MYLTPHTCMYLFSICFRICKAVSDFCLGQFEDRWKARTKSSTINVIAALLVEKPGEKMPKVVVLATGTTMKRECSYSLNKGDANEYMWGLCDGHAESVCYRLASFYLINEIHKHNEKSGNSILENNGGYALRDGIKFHFFTTQPPCGFMANEKRYYLSWRIPFKEKPHCLKCSSTILIGTYLGIQGPLSHLFREPIYISSITIPKSKNFTTERCTYIKNSFKNFKVMFDEIVNDRGNIYKLLIPDVEIADVELQKLFPCYFISYDNEDFSKFLKEIEENHSEKENKKAAGAVSTNSNIGSHIMVFNLKDGICDLKDEVREDTELKLKSAAKQFFPEEMIKRIKQVNLKQLRNAQQWLSKVLDINEALKGLQGLVTEKMGNKFSGAMCQNDDTVSRQLSELEQYKCKLGELHVKVNNFKKVFCADMKQFEESDDNIQAVITATSLSDAAKKVRSDSKAMMDNLDLLNDSMNDLEIDTKSVADKLVDHHHCKETWDDLQKFVKSMEKVVSSSDYNLFNQELMGCDWARYMKSIDKDIEDN